MTGDAEAGDGAEVDVTVTSLELHREQLRPARSPAFKVTIRPVQLASPAFNRFLYTAVGGHQHWIDRLPWTYDDWLAWLDREALETWVAYHLGNPLGYVELEVQPERTVEIASFGVLPEFRRRRIGGHLLTHAVRRGFALDADRVWVHTCTLDGADALATYTGRGFTPFAQERTTQRLHTDPGPWAGARAPLSHP